MGQFFHSPIQFLSCVVKLSIGVNILSMESVCGLPKEKTVTQRKSLGGALGIRSGKSAAYQIQGDTTEVSRVHSSVVQVCGGQFRDSKG